MARMLMRFIHDLRKVPCLRNSLIYVVPESNLSGTQDVCRAIIKMANIYILCDYELYYGVNTNKNKERIVRHARDEIERDAFVFHHHVIAPYSLSEEMRSKPHADRVTKAKRQFETQLTAFEYIEDNKLRSIVAAYSEKTQLNDMVLAFIIALYHSAVFQKYPDWYFARSAKRGEKRPLLTIGDMPQQLQSQ